MKAIVYREFGKPREALRLEDIERPVPKDDEVLVRVHAASVNPVDVHVLGSRIVRMMTQSPTRGLRATLRMSATASGHPHPQRLDERQPR